MKTEVWRSLLKQLGRPSGKTEDELHAFVLKVLQHGEVNIGQLGGICGPPFEKLKRTGLMKDIRSFGEWVGLMPEVQVTGGSQGRQIAQLRNQTQTQTAQSLKNLEAKKTKKAKRKDRVRQDMQTSNTEHERPATFHPVPPAGGYHPYPGASCTPHGFPTLGNPMPGPYAYGPPQPAAWYPLYPMHGAHHTPPPAYGIAWGQPVGTNAALSASSMSASAGQGTSKRRSRTPRRKRRRRKNCSISSAYSDTSSYSTSSGSYSSKHVSRNDADISDVLDTVRAEVRNLSGSQASDHVQHEPSPPALVDEAQVTQWKEWLCELDAGRGAFLQYLEALQREFTDLQQLAEAAQDIAEGCSIVEAVDPSVFEVLGVKSLGHKLVLARAIKHLAFSNDRNR